MKEYIWEKAFARTWKADKWDEYSDGLLSIATFIRLNGGETRGIWHGYIGELRDIDADGILLDKRLNPVINFYAADKPYYVYENEPAVVEQIAKEHDITIQNYIDWVNIPEIVQQAEEEYQKSPITNEWKAWSAKNKALFKDLGDLVKEFNETHTQFLPFSMRLYYRESDGMMDMTCFHADINIDRDSVQRELPLEQRKEILEQAQMICESFGKFLKQKYSKE